MAKTTLDTFFDREDNWEANYNNMDFFMWNPQRLRWCLVSIHPDIIKDNPFQGCVDLDTLEIKNQEAFDLMMAEDTDLVQMVEDKDWDWLGDDFEHMESYLLFIMQHDPTFCYEARPAGKYDSEYLHIRTWDIPKEYNKTPELRDAYIAGTCMESGGEYYMDSEVTELGRAFG